MSEPDRGTDGDVRTDGSGGAGGDRDAPADGNGSADGDGPVDGDASADLDGLLDELHEHLAATQELPVERTASRWIGEAEAIAADLATAQLEDAVVAERLGHVVDLLAEVEETGDPTADEHVAAAADLAAIGLERLDA